MTAPREIYDRREAYEDDADNVRGDYHAAIGSLVDMAKAQAKGDRELAQLRATIKRVEAVLDGPQRPSVIVEGVTHVSAYRIRAALEGES